VVALSGEVSGVGVMVVIVATALETAAEVAAVASLPLGAQREAPAIELVAARSEEDANMMVETRK
jgi:hypothetical protein